MADPSRASRTSFSVIKPAQVISRLRSAASWRLSWLFWRVQSIPRRRTVHVNRLGFDLVLDLRDSEQYNIYRHGTYEPKLSDRLRGELRLGDVYVDVGAHIGVHPLAAARQLQLLGDGHVYAFEPTPDSADRLAKTAERNRITNLTLVRAAVGQVTGQMELKRVGAFGTDEPSARSAFGSGHVVGVFPSVRFDDWAETTGLTRLDLIKMDIERGELAALLGMRDALARLRPRLLFIEVNAVTLGRAGVTREQLYAELARSGYAPTESVGDNATFTNVVFTRRDPPTEFE